MCLGSDRFLTPTTTVSSAGRLEVPVQTSHPCTVLPADGADRVTAPVGDDDSVGLAVTVGGADPAVVTVTVALGCGWARSWLTGFFNARNPDVPMLAMPITITSADRYGPCGPAGATRCSNCLATTNTPSATSAIPSTSRM